MKEGDLDTYITEFETLARQAGYPFKLLICSPMDYHDPYLKRFFKWMTRKRLKNGRMRLDADNSNTST